jgi:hypothetical protein
MPCYSSDGRRVRVAEACGADTRIRLSAFLESNIIFQMAIPSSTPTYQFSPKPPAISGLVRYFSCGTTNGVGSIIRLDGVTTSAQTRVSVMDSVAS